MRKTCCNRPIVHRYQSLSKSWPSVSHRTKCSDKIIMKRWKTIKNKRFWSTLAASNFSSIFSTISSVGFSPTSIFLRLFVASSSESLDDDSTRDNFSFASDNSVPSEKSRNNQYLQQKMNQGDRKQIVWNLPNLMTCLFIFLIVRCRISHKYILVKSLFISFEKIHVATAEHSTTCVFNNLSINTHIICWWLLQSSYKLCSKQICASSDSAIVYCNRRRSRSFVYKYRYHRHHQLWMKVTKSENERK